MKQKRLQLDTIIMENGGLIKPVRAARKKYDIYLEQRRSEKKGQKSKKIANCRGILCKIYVNLLMKNL